MPPSHNRLGLSHFHTNPPNASSSSRLLHASHNLVVAAAAQTSAATHISADQSWESQLVCLFMILGFVACYHLCCYVYTAGGFRQLPAVDFDAVDRFVNAESEGEASGSGNKNQGVSASIGKTQGTSAS
ncbi:hypothetical protein C8R43DRAFT_1241242 [Mycena crocata]|nr:hypothetical protein C8R43DRAFT_1241242 [Mycena crocata]